MISKTEKTYWVKIYMSGPIAGAEQIIRKECLRGLCVTIDSTKFIYTGGEEFGFVVGLINYPRFPTTPMKLWHQAKRLARLLLKGTYQFSALLLAPDKTVWISTRKE